MKRLSAYLTPHFHIHKSRIIFILVTILAFIGAIYAVRLVLHTNDPAIAHKNLPDLCNELGATIPATDVTHIQVSELGDHPEQRDLVIDIDFKDDNACKANLETVKEIFYRKSPDITTQTARLYLDIVDYNNETSSTRIV